MSELEQSQAHGRPRAMEFVRVQVSTMQINRTDEVLAQLGQEGWEIAAVASNDSYLHIWLKRQGALAPGRPLSIAL